MVNIGFRGDGRTSSVGCLGARVTPFALSPRGLLGVLPFITGGEKEMLEFMITFLFL